MPGYLAYIVSISAMLFAALSGLTLFAFVRHLDPPEVAAPAVRMPLPELQKIAV